MASPRDEAVSLTDTLDERELLIKTIAVKIECGNFEDPLLPRRTVPVVESEEAEPELVSDAGGKGRNRSRPFMFRLFALNKHGILKEVTSEKEAGDDPGSKEVVSEKQSVRHQDNLDYREQVRRFFAIPENKNKPYENSRIFRFCFDRPSLDSIPIVVGELGYLKPNHSEGHPVAEHLDLSRYLRVLSVRFSQP
jgi:hypothetical protein